MGDLVLEGLVPKVVTSAIIGKGGHAIKELRERSGARIDIGQPTGNRPWDEQTITVAGPGQSLEMVMYEVSQEIQRKNTEEWFERWSSNPGTGGKGVRDGVKGKANKGKGDHL